VTPAASTAAAHHPNQDRLLARAPARASMAVFLTDGPVFLISLISLISLAARAARFVINFLPPVH